MRISQGGNTGRKHNPAGGISDTLHKPFKQLNKEVVTVFKDMDPAGGVRDIFAQTFPTLE